MQSFTKLLGTGVISATLSIFFLSTQLPFVVLYTPNEDFLSSAKASTLPFKQSRNKYFHIQIHHLQCVLH